MPKINHIQIITTVSEFGSSITNSKGVAILFYATNHSGYFLMMRDGFKHILSDSQYEGIMLYRINCESEELDDIRDALCLRVSPTIIVFENGKPIVIIEKPLNKKGLTDLIKKIDKMSVKTGLYKQETDFSKTRLTKMNGSEDINLIEEIENINEMRNINLERMKKDKKMKDKKMKDKKMKDKNKDKKRKEKKKDRKDKKKDRKKGKKKVEEALIERSSTHDNQSNEELALSVEVTESIEALSTS